MSNLTAREKAFMYAITLLIIIVLGYFFGIRTLNNKYEQYKEDLQTLEERKVFLDQLKTDNQNMTAEIDNLKELCVGIENSFIDELETECIEQYVLEKFEKEGCPYLVEITSTDVAMGAVTYPDGTTCPDGLNCLQVAVIYSSTDGYTIPQYNRTPDFTEGAQVPAAETITELMGQMGQGVYGERHGYEEFIKALKKINAENPSCIKVNDFSVAEDGGIMTLSATINFYGISLRNRMSEDTRTEAYTYWQGHKGVDTEGGFIGFPYVCDDPDSLWYGVVNMSFDDTISKPFAAYWANKLFDAQLEAVNGDIKALLNFGAEEEEVPAETTPEN